MTGIMLRNLRHHKSQQVVGKPVSKAWVVSEAGRASWIISIALWSAYLLHPHGTSYLLDFHVHAAGAWDLLDGTLYRAELVHPGRLPVDRFNYPPLAAAIAVPFAWLPDQVGGSAWVILDIVAMAGACVLATRILGLAPGWAGIGFGLFSVYPWALSTLLGNINPLVLFLVLLFADLHLRGKQVESGIILGIAVGLKLWPITLVPLLLRERRWSAIVWLAWLLVLQAAVTVFLLGSDVVPHMIANLTYRLPLGPEDFVIGPSALEWWPRWGGYLLAALLLLVPARGRMGIGLAMLAGMALVPNLWRHYFPTVVGAGLLILADVYRSRRRGQHAPDSLDGVHTANGLDASM
jgi:hypothetical protein